MLKLELEFPWSKMTMKWCVWCTDFNSMDHWGEVADQMITDERFMALVDAGHKLGTTDKFQNSSGCVNGNVVLLDRLKNPHRSGFYNGEHIEPDIK